MYLVEGGGSEAEEGEKEDGLNCQQEEGGDGRLGARGEGGGGVGATVGHSAHCSAQCMARYPSTKGLHCRLCSHPMQKLPLDVLQRGTKQRGTEQRPPPPQQPRPLPPHCGVHNTRTCRVVLDRGSQPRAKQHTKP